MPFSVQDEKSSDPFAETTNAPLTVIVREAAGSVCVPLAAPSARLATFGFASRVTV